ncbi:hypothetical protein B566_EDAN009961 [Ephemera danica]|nr:hypothetical protein B566_EDAN009961 [Ephemera danica]
MPSKIDVEYCGSCGHKKQFEELAARLKEALPNAEVHSKLQTLAFPDYDDVVEIAKDSEQGNAPSRQVKQQPINCCVS